jgi:hypothetical protein
MLKKLKIRVLTPAAPNRDRLFAGAYRAATGWTETWRTQ